MEHGYPQEGQVNVIAEVPRGRNFGRITEKRPLKKVSDRPQMESKGVNNFSLYAERTDVVHF
jgi:hypothetical protein